MRQDKLDYVITEAKNGDIDAICTVINHYIDNNYFEEAYKWIELAMDSIKDAPDVAHIQYLYSVYCRETDDIDSMKTYLNKARKEGSPCANLVVGNFYCKGVYGYPKDIVKAIEHWILSAFEDNKYAWDNVRFYLKEFLDGKYPKDEVYRLEDYLNNNISKFRKNRLRSDVILYKLHEIIKGKEYASEYFRENIKPYQVVKNGLASFFMKIISTGGLHNCNIDIPANENSFFVKYKYVMLGLLVSSFVYLLFFDISGRKLEPKKLNVNDCVFTVKGHYRIKGSTDDFMISLNPHDGLSQHYFIEFYNESNRSQFIQNYIQNHPHYEWEALPNEHLIIYRKKINLDGINIDDLIGKKKLDDINMDGYVVFGKTFFMDFGTFNNDAKELLDSCNETWKGVL